jgi:hypothetical protein
LKKIAKLVIDDGTIWKIKPTEDLRLKCEDILSQLSLTNDFMSYKTRTKMKDLIVDAKSFIMASLSNDIISRIKLPRNQLIDDIIRDRTN